MLTCVSMFTDVCVSECLCIVYANELQLAIQAYYYCLFFFFLVANPSSSLHWRYTVLFITIVTFYNVFFYHILYVRNNIKSHFQI